MKNYIYIFLGITLFIACNSSGKKEIEVINEGNENLVTVTKAQFENSKMALGTITSQEFTERIKTNGFIDVPPANKADVSAVMGGYIKSSPMLVGDKVTKGQLLMTIENPDFIEIQQNYLELYESLTYLKSEYERQKTLYDEKITSEKNFLQAESLYKSTLAQFNGIAQKLRLMNINLERLKAGNITSVLPVYAPISGSISNVFVTVGKFMEPTNVLLEIIDSSHKHLELIVFEKDVLKIKPNQLILFQIPENSNESFEAKVHLVGKSIDQKNRTAKVHGHIVNEKEPLLVGMYVEAEIITNTENKMALPLEALIEENNGFYVLLLKSKNEQYYEFEKTPVVIGETTEEWVEIIDLEGKFKEKQLLVEGVFIPVAEEA